ncbi:TonB-dependent receptor [Vibrio sp. D404a]|uniref:TonB-dependent receptor plug domain-containing protein n=1 Tax=unclassified Vibrio TaxID=2614977 RepID=UPI002553A23D|nr:MULTISPECIES: TonB-dependent receptor [unclassified Vibrio]MDK9738054.1 TonB-dependent receptor [Vibrio sp. D404a]MDK9796345.1 TonB-dependent receptor [Vibrio sp. D449a]
MIYRQTCLGLALLGAYSTQAQDIHLDELLNMSLEELSMLDVQIETATKTSEKLADIPSSVYVLSNERIMRSGVKSIAEALMLVPGIKVTKFNEGSWFVSSRGFHDGLYNKMLVMMDGRSLFSPVYGGTYWADIDYILADIDRIEVLKGPGGTIWGGNAVNGVVNIITKSAEETQGSYVSGLASNSDNYQVSARHGLAFNDELFARAYYKYKEVPEYQGSDVLLKHQSAGVVIEPVDHMQRWSLRFGGEQSRSDFQAYTIHYNSDGTWNDFSSAPSSNESHSFYTQFNHQLDINNQTSLAYSLWGEYNEDSALDAPGSYTTLDFDATVNSARSDSHKVTFGGGIRYMHLDFSSSQLSDVDWYEPDYYRRAYDIETANDYIINTFAQSTKWWGEQVSLTLGAKVEHFTQNNSTELSPQLRLLYKPVQAHTLWGGVSRAVVAPSYMDSNSAYFFNSYAGDQYYLDIYKPNPDLKNEDVVTAEIGYRYSGFNGFEVDATLYASEHNNIKSHSYDDSDIPAPHIYVGRLSDDYSAQTYGLELGATIQMNESLTGYLSYAYASLEGERIGDDPTSSELTASYYDIDNEHIATAQLLWDVSNEIQFDVLAKYINVNYPDYWQADNGTKYPWASYDHSLAFDARLAWQMSQRYPLVELIAENIGKHHGYRAEMTSKKVVNQQSVFVRLSHEF